MKINSRLHLTLIYLALATAWIGFADRALGHVIADHQRLILATTTAGWMFVMGTGWLLFWVMGQRERRVMSAHQAVDGDRERMVNVLLGALRLSRGDTEDHSRRVAHVAEGLGRLAGLRAEALQDLKWGALLRDVGHLATPKAHIGKQTRLPTPG